MDSLSMEYLGVWLQASLARSPPGMTYEDWQPWQQWIHGPGAAWGSYTYDVVLHTQGLAEISLDPKLLQMWARNTGKRIDAVGATTTAFDIFEARRYAGWSAVAQLLGYQALWLINFPTLPLGDLWLIAEQIDDAARALAHRHRIRTWCVGEQAPT